MWELSLSAYPMARPFLWNMLMMIIVIVKMDLMNQVGLVTIFV